MGVQLLGFGCPLLDIVIDGSHDLLERYGLEPNGEILASGELLSIFEYVAENYKTQVQYLPGGATLNALRVAQWCLGKAGSTAVIGSLANDKFGDMLRREMSSAQVDGLFQVKTDLPTGTCLVICTGQERSLVTNQGSATLFTLDYFKEHKVQTAIQQSQFYYSSGYSLIGCPEGVEKLAKHASQTAGKVFALNLAAVYVCDKYAERLKQVLPHVDVLFGNEAEADQFAKACGWKVQTRHEIAQRLCGWERVGEGRQPRIVVITQGPLPALLAYEGKVSEYPPLPVSAAEIVDTNGAGDAFVGGFLSSLMKKESPKEATLCGHSAAGFVLRQRGCQLPLP